MAGFADIGAWFGAGLRVGVELGSGRFEVFTRVIGDKDAACLTFLHGFPTCSWDWVEVVDALGAGRRVLLFDFLGFGDSDKPRGHRYSIHEQADLTEALWRRFGVERTDLVAHDYGVSVAQELLARGSREGRGPRSTAWASSTVASTPTCTARCWSSGCSATPCSVRWSAG